MDEMVINLLDFFTEYCEAGISSDTLRNTITDIAPKLRVKDDMEEVYHFLMLGSLPAGDKKDF